MLNKLSRIALLGCLLVGASLLTGCARLKLTPPTASVDNIQMVRASGIAPAAVSDFTLAPGVPKSVDVSVSIRAATLFSPYNDSLARYLQEALRVELDAAGLLDPASSTVIAGELTDNEVDAGIAEGKAKLGARFKVTRNGQAIYDKQLVEAESWESSFVGAIAIPAAINHYTSLYRKLVTQLLKDDAFKQALKRP